jgi:hypothetical protein
MKSKKSSGGIGLLVSAVATCALGAPASAQPKQEPSDQAQILGAVNAVFAAFQTDDAAKFDALIAPGFYMFDGGRRFTGNSLVAFLKQQHLAGYRYEWSVTEPDVHVTGSTAWIAYVDVGRVTDPAGNVTQKTWLESAFLQKQAGTWKFVFFHSAPVPAAAPTSPKK